MSQFEHQAVVETIKRGRYGAIRFTLGPLGLCLAITGISSAAGLGFIIPLYGEAQSHGPIGVLELRHLVINQSFGVAASLAIGAATLLFKGSRRSE